MINGVVRVAGFFYITKGDMLNIARKQGLEELLALACTGVKCYRAGGSPATNGRLHSAYKKR
jgi:hypothetical protein